VCVGSFRRRCVRGGGVLMGFLRVLVSRDCVLVGSFVVTLFVVLGG
jgi:hypothetical protein